jgi:conserved repeat domain
MEQMHQDVGSLAAGDVFVQSATEAANGLPVGLDINSIPTDKITIDMAFDVVMGWVDPYQTVSITASDYSGYGFAVADAIGFFWTPIWHTTDGHSLGISCGWPIEITPEGETGITLSPKCLTSANMNVITDTVSGGIDGMGAGIEVTARLGISGGNWQIPPVSGAPEATAITDASGNFSTSLPDVDLGAESLVALDFEQAGVNIRNYVTPQNVFLVHQMNAIGGYADIDQSVSATVYEGTSTTARWSGSTKASEPFGFYQFENVSIETGDTISVSLDGGPTLTATVSALGNFSFDASANTMHGEAADGAAIRTSLWQKEGELRTYSEEHDTADSSGFNITFSADLKAYEDVLVVSTDEDGNQIQITSGPPYVLAVQNPNHEYDCVVGRLHAPGQPLFVTLEKGDGEVYVRDTGWTSDVGNGFSSGCFVIRAPDWSWGPIKMDPGDIAMYSNGSDWSQSVEVIGFDYSWDTASDTISGQNMPVGEVVVTPYNWSNYLYPSYASTADKVEIVTGTYSVSFPNFDIRDGSPIELAHYNSDGMGNLYNGWSSLSLPYFELQLHHNAISGMVIIPDDPVTARLFENASATEPIITTSQDDDGNPYYFWIGDLGGNLLEPGMRVELSSASGWSAEMIVPSLEISGDPDSDEITASGPAGLLVIESNHDEWYLGKFVPSNGSSPVLLDTMWSGFELYKGDTIALTYQAEDGNRARIEVRAGYSLYDLFLNVNYDHDWIEGWYPPGYDATLWVTDSDGVEKARTTITTSVIPWWGGGTGFSTNLEGVIWDPERPDIQPGDWVYGEVTVDQTTYSAQVQLGTISGTLDAEADSFTGTVSAPWLPDYANVMVQCHPWGAPEGTNSRETTVIPDGLHEFTCDWSGEWDIQPGQEIAVLYMDPAEHWVFSVHAAYTEELILRVHYDHEWISGMYEAGHDVHLEILDSLGDEKAHIDLITGYVDGWGSTTGFDTNMEGANWIPSRPDIQPGDTIHGEVDDGSEFTADVQIGWVTADLDLDNDQVSGTVDAEWLPQNEEVKVRCEIWDWNSPPNKEDWVLPNGTDTYLCDWTDDGYDLNETSNLMVAYFDPAMHELIGDFRYPAPRLRIEKWLEGGEPGEGGVATFNIQYRNEGDATAINTIITDTFEQGLTYISDTSGLPKTEDGNQVVWTLGSLNPGEQIEFKVFAHVDAVVGDLVINTATISSETPDAGNPEDRTRTWQGTVIANDTHLNVGKDTWTWNPAPGQNFVYRINVCNNGPTGSTELTLTDTLPDAVSFVNWWSGYAGWEEISIVGQTLTLAYPSIPGWSCYEVYIQVTLDPEAQEKDELINTAQISAANDLETDDNQTTLYHNVGAPYVDLSIGMNWHSGSLVPGGQYRYGVYFRNDGNMSVPGPIEVSTTLPAGTSFAGWDHWDWAGVGGPVLDGNTVTWPVDDLEPGYSGVIEVFVNIDPGTAPGTELVHIADIEVQEGEDYTENNTASFTETVHPHGPNLRIRKWGDWHGDSRNAWYQLQVENVGDETVQNVVIRDDYPAEMQLDGGIGANFWQWWDWEDFPEDNYLTVTLERLEPGWNVGVNFNVVIPGDDPVPSGLVFTNTAEVTLDPADTNPSDNSAEYLLGSGPDMFVKKMLLDGGFYPGQEVTYLLEFGNAQPGHTWWWNMTGNAILVDTLPEGMTFVSSYWHCYQEENEWCELTPTIDGQELTWETWPLNAGEGHVLVLTVLIDDEIEEGNALINTIEISSDQPTVDLDPFVDNNSSSFVPVLNLEAPLITSADSTTFAFGEIGSFIVTTSGFPTPYVWTDDDLPSWLTLEDQGDGTAILSGTPPQEGGVDYFLLKAANGVTPNAEQSFTLTWEGAPDYPIFLPLILR